VKILVPMKRVADPDNANKVKISPEGDKVTCEGLEWKPNPFDEYAVETALRILETSPNAADLRGEVVVATVGPTDTSKQIRQGLAMGADRGIIVEGEDDDLDATVVARALAKLVEKESPDLVLMGKQAVDGDSNQVAQMLAEMLDWPQATFAGAVEVPADLSSATVIREVDGGAVTMTVQFPAVISVDLRIVAPVAVKNNVTPADKPYPDGPRFVALRGLKKAKKKPIEKHTLADLGVDTTRRVNTLSFTAPPARQAGVIVDSVEALVDKLKNEARVL
jgi:electron transfer flavoprotein beta subunit